MAQSRNITVTTKQRSTGSFNIYLQIYYLWILILKLPACFTTLLWESFREKSQAHKVQAGTQEGYSKIHVMCHFRISRLITASCSLFSDMYNSNIRTVCMKFISKTFSFCTLNSIPCFWHKYLVMNNFWISAKI